MAHPQRHPPKPVLGSSSLRWGIPLALMVCIVLAFIDKIAIAALFTDPVFEQTLGLQHAPQLKGLLMSVFLLSYGLSSCLLSGIGDWIGHKTLLLGMMLAWGLIVAAMGLVSSYPLMLLLRGLLGIAEGPLIALAYAIVKTSFPPRQLARASVLWLLGTPLGASLGFPLTLWLLHHFGWRCTFLVSAALGLLTISLILWVLRDYRQPVMAPARQDQSNSRFDVWKTSAQALLRNRHFWLLCLSNLGAMAYLWGLNSWLPSYLIEQLHVPRAAAGLYTSLPFACMCGGEILGALVSDRYGRRAHWYSWGLAAAGLSLLGVLSAQPDLILAAIASSAFCWGFGIAGVFALLARISGPALSGTAGGMFTGAGNLAGALMAWLMGALAARTQGMEAGLVSLAVITLLAAAAALPLRHCDRVLTHPPDQGDCHEHHPQLERADAGPHRPLRNPQL